MTTSIPVGNNIQRQISDDRFIQVHNDGSDEAPPSTIYDPAVLHLSPKEKRRKEREVNEIESQSNNKDFEENTQTLDPEYHRENSTAIHIDGKTIRLPEEEVEDFADDIESELCCNGMIPLFPTLLFICIVSVVIGLTCLIMASVILSSQNQGIIGFSSLDELIISGKYLFPVGHVILSSLLMACGVLGVIVFFRRWRTSSNRARICGIVYNSASFLITLLCIILFCVVVTCWVIQKNKTVFTQDTWGNLVQTNPAFACSTEVRLGCAGYRITDCSFNFNDTSELYCPGHFCVDFCQIEEENVKQQALCSGCRNSKQQLDFSFSDFQAYAYQNQRLLQDPRGTPMENEHSPTRSS